MATLVHVSPTMFPEAGSVLLRVDISGDAAATVVVVRRTVGQVATEPIIAPAGFVAPNGDIALLDGSAVLIDTGAPLDTPFEYLASVSGGTLVLVAGPMTLPSSTVWRLGDPLAPYLDVPLVLSEVLSACSTAGAIVVLGLESDDYESQTILVRFDGVAAPRAISRPLSTPSTTLNLATRTLQDRDRIRALASPGRVLELRAPAVYGVAPRYVVVQGMSVARLTRDHRKVWRSVTLQLMETSQPSGGAYGQVGNRWVDLCDGPYATFAAATAAGAFWWAIAAGIVGGTYPVSMRTCASAAAEFATCALMAAGGRTCEELVGGL